MVVDLANHHFFFAKEKTRIRVVGIKNSWKYEKDLILLFNKKKKTYAIAKMANLLLKKIKNLLNSIMPFGFN